MLDLVTSLASPRAIRVEPAGTEIAKAKPARERICMAGAAPIHRAPRICSTKVAESVSSRAAAGTMKYATYLIVVRYPRRRRSMSLFIRENAGNRTVSTREDAFRGTVTPKE